jgi:hypothetical protein
MSMMTSPMPHSEALVNIFSFDQNAAAHLTERGRGQKIIAGRGSRSQNKLCDNENRIQYHY